MSELSKVIDSLEVKFFKLAKTIESLETNNGELLQLIQNLRATITNQEKKIRELEHEIESLKISNSLLGSEEYKKETKLKINSLIREIDYCIAQLSD